jgi:flagellar M-ring protein FliF
VVTPDEAAVAALPAPSTGAPAVAAGQPVLVSQEGERGPGVTQVVAPTPVKMTPDYQAARQIEFAQIQGEAHQASLQKVGELASRNPYETVSILRQWMHEKTA